MSLCQVLSETDKRMIADYIDSYASKYGTQRSASIDHILRFWDEEKSKYLYKLLGEKFIISKEVTFEKGYNELYSECDEMLWKTGNVFYNSFMQWINKNFDINFDQLDFRGYNLRNMMSADCLAKNIYSRGTFEIRMPNNKMMKVQHGCKPIKTLGKIANAFGLEGFEEFRIAHSMILNQKKIRGNLCLSIHPLDYMTMSDNDSDWTSCMSWKETGCYRQGTVEMMNSPMVVVAYLTGKEDMYIAHDNYWNNKKWRELYIVNEDFIGNVKAYPYRNDNITSEVLSWLKELATAAGLNSYKEEVLNYDTGEMINVDNVEMYITPVTNQMYNDFRCNQLAYLGKDFVEKIVRNYSVNYSGKSECMYCGAEYPDLDSEGSLVGWCCGEESIFCEWCGDHYSSSEEMIEVDGNWICQRCYENETFIDDITEETHIINNATALYIRVGDALYDTYLNLYRDDFCKDIMKDYFNELRVLEDERWGWCNKYYVTFDAFTDKTLDLFKNEWGVFENSEELFNAIKERPYLNKYKIQEGEASKVLYVTGYENVVA